MWKYFRKRAGEGSTYAGLAAVVAGLGMSLKVDEAPAVAEGILAAAPALTAGDWLGGLVAIAGAVAVAVRDKPD